MEYQQENKFYELDYRASAILHRYLLQFKAKTEVLLPVNICPIVEEVVLKSGLTPVYFDISEKHLLTINQQEVLNYLEKSEKTRRVILLNHTYGVDYSFDIFSSTLKKIYDISIIEDYCLSKPYFRNNENVDLSLSITVSDVIKRLHSNCLGVFL
jgi:dTDP-4-amino-4,6-dideoxygalactose transaminase